YDKLRGSVNGMSGTYYPETQILIIQGDYPVNTIRTVLQGKWDNSGIYNKEAFEKRKKEDRLREEADAEIERRKNLHDDIRDMTKQAPVSKMSDTDYIDTEKRLAEEAKKEKDKEIMEKKQRRKGVPLKEDEEER